MTNIVKDTAAKLSVAIVAVAMVFSAFAASASAQTTEELQQMINDLLAQIAQLEDATNVSAGTGACVSIPAPLTIGSTGADVTALQNVLIGNGYSIPAGATGYFGTQTQSALAAWQAANGVAPAVGYYGPITKAALDASCTPMDDMDDDMDDDMMDDDDDMDMSLSGEASLDNFELDDGESDIEEGDTDEVVGEITVEFQDGDAEISRLDISLVGTGSAEPWEAFETVSLWVDGDMVAEMDADDEDEYLDEDEGELRFTDLGIIAMEDEELEILIGVTVQDNLDSAELGDWDVQVESMRFFDADGVATTETSADGIGSDTAEFEIQEAGEDEELNISLASSNPDATDIVVDTDTDTNGVTIMIADLEAEDNDIELDKVVVLVETDGASTTAIVDEAYVVIDGETFDAESIIGTGAPTTLDSRFDNADEQGVWYVFDIDGDIVLDEDEEVEMEIVIDFNDTDDGNNYANGQTITASITSTELTYWEAEGADDLETSQFDGAANGDSHTLVAEGILVPVDGFSSEETTLGQDDDIGEFTLEFEVTAVEGDFYITDLATTSDEDNGVRYSVSGLGDGVVSATLTSTADEDTLGVFTIDEGETEVFTLTVTVSDQTSVIQPRVTLTEVNYTDETDGLVDGGAGVIEGTYLPMPASDFRSDVQTVQATS